MDFLLNTHKERTHAPTAVRVPPVSQPALHRPEAVDLPPAALSHRCWYFQQLLSSLS